MLLFCLYHKAGGDASGEAWKIEICLPPKNPHEWDVNAAKRDILPLLDSPEQVEKIFNRMLSGFAPLSPDTPHYTEMQLALRDVGMYQGGSPLLTPLPEAVLEAERQKKQAAKEAKRKAPAPQRTTSEAPPASGDRLAAAARALANKRWSTAQADQSGQLSLFSLATSAPLEPEPPTPAPEVQPPALPQVPEQSSTFVPSPYSAYKAIKGAHLDGIVFIRWETSLRCTARMPGPPHLCWTWDCLNVSCGYVF